MEKILIIEDEIKISELIKRELVLQGFEVNILHDGKSAVEQFSDINPDLILLDWMLPGLNGLEVLRYIRSSSPVPVIMLTARDDPIDRVTGLEIGADDYVIKPFHMAELIARIRAILRQEKRILAYVKKENSNSRPCIIHFKDLVLDPTQHTFQISNQLISLSALEFELLELFISNQGRTFNRRYLVENIWESEYIDGERSVDNVILRLRKKLGKYGSHLQTVRSIGYRFSDTAGKN